MPDSPRKRTRSERLRMFVAGLLIKAVLGLLLVFVIAAIVAPRLFDTHDDLMTILAFGLWIACPLALFFLGWELLVEFRKIDDEHSS